MGLCVENRFFSWTLQFSILDCLEQKNEGEVNECLKDHGLECDVEQVNVKGHLARHSALTYPNRVFLHRNLFEPLAQRLSNVELCIAHCAKGLVQTKQICQKKESLESF